LDDGLHAMVANPRCEVTVSVPVGTTALYIGHREQHTSRAAPPELRRSQSRGRPERLIEEITRDICGGSTGEEQIA
jgi:hypothetical protein